MVQSPYSVSLEVYQIHAIWGVYEIHVISNYRKRPITPTNYTVNRQDIQSEWCENMKTAMIRNFLDRSSILAIKLSALMNDNISQLSMVHWNDFMLCTLWMMYWCCQYIICRYFTTALKIDPTRNIRMVVEFVNNHKSIIILHDY